MPIQVKDKDIPEDTGHNWEDYYSYMSLVYADRKGLLAACDKLMSEGLASKMEKRFVEYKEGKLKTVLYHNEEFPRVRDICMSKGEVKSIEPIFSAVCFTADGPNAENWKNIFTKKYPSSPEEQVHQGTTYIRTRTKS